MKIYGTHIIGASPKERKMLLARRFFAEGYASERGWDISDLTFDRIMEIRKQPGWKVFNIEG